MARTNVDNVQVNVEINGERAGSSLKEMRTNVKALAKELEALPAQTEEWYKKLEQYKEAKAALQNVESDVKGVGDAMKATSQSTSLMSGALDTLKSAILPLLAFSTVVNAFRSGITAFNEQTQASTALTNALDGNSAAVDRLSKQADELSQITLFKDQEIVKAQSVLALYADNEEQIRRLTPIVLDYATSTGQALDQAAETIGVALREEAGQLEDLGVKFDEATPKAERLSIIQGVLAERTGGAAEAAAKAGTGPLQLLSNRFGEILEKVGGLVVKLVDLFKPALDATLAAVGPVIDGIGFLADKVSALSTRIQGFFNTINGGAVDVTKFVGELRDKLAQQYRDMTDAERKHWEETAKLTVEQRKQIIARAAELDQQELDQQAAALAAKNAADAEGAAKRKELAKKAAEDMAAADAEIARLRAEAIEDDRQRELALLQLKYEAELVQVVGSEKQKHEQRLLLEDAYNRDKLTINARYDDEFDLFLNQAAAKREKTTDTILTKELDRLNQQADKELELARTTATKKVGIDADAERQRLENAKRAAEQRRKIEETGRQTLADGLSFFVELLSQDQDARKKHAQAIKAFETGKVFVNLYTEIQNIWKHAADLGPAGTIFAAIQSAFATFRAGLAVNNIQTQKFEYGGIAKGPRHAQGGVKLVDSSTGQVTGEMEGGEPYMILSRETYGNNRPVIDALLHSSMYQRGRSIFADGGIFAPSMPSVSLPASPSAGLMGSNQEIVMELQLTRRAFAEIPRQWQAVVSLGQLSQTASEADQIRRESRL